MDSIHPIVNTDNACVIGGERTAARAAVATAAPFHPLPGVTTVHCPVAKPVAEAYRDLHDFTTQPAKNVTYFSGINGGAYDVNRESIKDSILGQALDHFDCKVCADAYERGFRLFIECGPGQSCSRMLSENLQAHDDVVALSAAPGPNRQVRFPERPQPPQPRCSGTHRGPRGLDAMFAEDGVTVDLRPKRVPIAKKAVTAAAGIANSDTCCKQARSPRSLPPAMRRHQLLLDKTGSLQQLPHLLQLLRLRQSTRHIALRRLLGLLFCNT